MFSKSDLYFEKDSSIRLTDKYLMEPATLFSLIFRRNQSILLALIFIRTRSTFVFVCFIVTRTRYVDAFRLFLIHRSNLKFIFLMCVVPTTYDLTLWVNSITFFLLLSIL